MTQAGAESRCVAFDNRRTEPLASVGYLAAMCGLLTPALGRRIEMWAVALALAPPLLFWGLFECNGCTELRTCFVGI